MNLCLFSSRQTHLTCLEPDSSGRPMISSVDNRGKRFTHYIEEDIIDFEILHDIARHAAYKTMFEFNIPDGDII